MAETSKPGPNGTPEAIANPADWRFWGRHLLPPRAIQNPFASARSLEVYGDSSGMQVKVRAGEAYIQGVTYTTDGATLPIAVNSSTLPRRDLVSLRYSSDGPTRLKVTTGTPAANPSTPTPVRTETTWDLVLATVLIPAGAGTAGNAVQSIPSTNVTPRQAPAMYPMYQGRGRIGYSETRVYGATWTSETMVTAVGINDIQVHPGERLRATLSILLQGSHVDDLALVRLYERDGGGTPILGDRLVARMSCPILSATHTTTWTSVHEWNAAPVYGVRSYGLSLERAVGTGTVQIAGNDDARSSIMIDSVTRIFGEATEII